MSVWRVNGESTGALPVDDRAVQYGDGLFETIAIRGGEPRHWDLHMDRLMGGSERLAIEAPPVQELRQELELALAEGNVDTNFAIAKIILTAGHGPRGYRRAEKTATTTAIAAFPSRPRPIESYRDGVAVSVCQTRLAQQPQFAGIKTLNRLEQVVGQTELQGDDVVDGLMLDTDDRLICGTMSNLFIVRNKTVITPALTRCGVSGTMRRKVMELVDTNKMDYEVRDVGMNELDDCEEVFLSNSQFGVLPVRECANRRWGVGQTTRGIMALIADAGVTECRI